MCHTMRDNLVVAFYHDWAILFNEDLIFKNKTVWSDVIPVVDTRLENFGVAPCHLSSEQTGCICVFNVTGQNLDDIQCKSVNNKRLAKVTEHIGWTFWMLRLMVNKKGTGLIIYNVATESIIVEDELPVYPYEF